MKARIGVGERMAGAKRPTHLFDVQQLGQHRGEPHAGKTSPNGDGITAGEAEETPAGLVQNEVAKWRTTGRF